MDMQNDFDRLLFFEHARKTAEATYNENPRDADVRTIIIFFILWFVQMEWLPASLSFYLFVLVVWEFPFFCCWENVEKKKFHYESIFH